MPLTEPDALTSAFPSAWCGAANFDARAHSSHRESNGLPADRHHAGVASTIVREGFVQLALRGARPALRGVAFGSRRALRSR